MALPGNAGWGLFTYPFRWKWTSVGSGQSGVSGEDAYPTLERGEFL